MQPQPIKFFPRRWCPSDLSLGVSSSNGLPSSGSLSSGTPYVAALRRSTDGVRASQPAPRMTTIHVMWRALMATQQARHRPEQQAVCHSIRRRCNTQHMRPDKGYTGCIRARRCCLSLMHRLLPSNRIEELASCHDYRLSRMLLYPWVAFDVVTQASLPRRTTTTPTAPYLSAHFPTGLTLPYKSGLCPSTSCSCITNFEYTLTFASRSPDPIISKAADSPHYPSCRTVPVPRHPTPGLALRHHLTHLHHDHDPIPIFGVFPPSPSEIARVLLDGGVITNPKDSQGQTPWHAWLKAEGTMISLLDYYWSAARMSTCQTMITIPITFGIGGGNCNPARSARPTEPEWETSQAPPSVARLRSFGT